jgi:hypothetical protein
MSKDEATQYLKLRKIEEQVAEQIYEFVGGRIIHLKEVADAILQGEKLPGIYLIYYIITLPTLQTSTCRCICRALFGRDPPRGQISRRSDQDPTRALRNDPFPYSTYAAIVGHRAGNELLESNIFPRFQL